MKSPKNVIGGPLELCSSSPVTGIYRNGECDTNGFDRGIHVVCAQVTEEFLSFTRSMGNDLSSPAPDLDFPGLKPGDKWCLCASRWKEALEAGVAPRIVLNATHEKALEYVDLEDMREYALED